MNKKPIRNILLEFTCFISLIYCLVNVLSIFQLPEEYSAPSPDQLNHTQGLAIQDIIPKKLHSRFGSRRTEILTVKNSDELNRYSCSIYYEQSCYINKFKNILSKDIFNVDVGIKWAERGGRRVVYELTIGNKVELDFFTLTKKYKIEYQNRNIELIYNIQQLAISLLIFLISTVLIVKHNKPKQTD